MNLFVNDVGLWCQKKRNSTKYGACSRVVCLYWGVKGVCCFKGINCGINSKSGCFEFCAMPGGRLFIW